SELLSWVLSCFPHAFRHAVMGGALMPSAIEGMSESMTALGAVSALSSLIPSFSPTTKPNDLFLFRAARSHDLDADLALVEQLTERHNELGLFHPLGFGLFGDDCGRIAVTGLCRRKLLASLNQLFANRDECVLD